MPLTRLLAVAEDRWRCSPVLRQDESQAISESFLRPKVDWFETASEDACENGGVTRNDSSRVLGYLSLSQFASAKTLWRDAGAKTPLVSVTYP